MFVKNVQKCLTGKGNIVYASNSRLSDSSILKIGLTTTSTITPYSKPSRIIRSNADGIYSHKPMFTK